MKKVIRCCVAQYIFGLNVSKVPQKSIFLNNTLNMCIYNTFNNNVKILI